MRRRCALDRLVVGLALVWAFVAPTPSSAQGGSAPSGHSIKVDLPVRLEKANVVFDMSHLSLAGDTPVGLKYMHLLATHFKEGSIKGQIIGIFHGEAAYLTLTDSAYNTYRHVDTGNPYKGLIAELIQQGVQIEECAVSMKHHHWGNQDLLPKVKVNAGAIGRLIQLVQEGYVQIQP